MTSVHCSLDVIFLFLLKYTKTFHSIPVDYSGVVGNLELICMKNIEVFQKGVW